MMAVESIAQILMVLLAIVASPIDDGESLHVDFVERQSIEQMQVERDKNTYTVFEGVDDEKKKVATIEKSDEGEAKWVIQEGEAKKRTVDLGELLGDTEPGELAEADDKVVSVGEQHKVKMMRSAKVLYLKSAQRFVVAHKP